MNFGEKLRTARKSLKLTQKDLAEAINAKHNSVSNWETNQNRPDPDTIGLLCEALNVDPNYFFDFEPAKNIFSIPEIMPLPKTKKVPRLGTIACGLPILAEENIDTYDYVDEDLNCDFTLSCQGDSMTPKIIENDVVLIRSQPEVENGQVAAVLIGDEATLKRVHRTEDTIILSAENPVYPPLIYTKDDLNKIKIIGKAVGLIRYFY